MPINWLRHPYGFDTCPVKFQVNLCGTFEILVGKDLENFILRSRRLETLGLCHAYGFDDILKFTCAEKLGGLELGQAWKNTPLADIPKPLVAIGLSKSSWAKRSIYNHTRHKTDTAAYPTATNLSFRRNPKASWLKRTSASTPEGNQTDASHLQADQRIARYDEKENNKLRNKRKVQIASSR